MPLRTDYTNDILDTSKNTERKYNIKNSNGTIVEENVTFEDVTDYTQEGSRFGASDINAITTRVNQLTASDGLDFRFATDGEGNYGYLKADDSFTPFKSPGVSQFKININYPGACDFILFTADKDMTMKINGHLESRAYGSVNVYNNDTVITNISGAWKLADVDTTTNLKKGDNIRFAVGLNGGADTSTNGRPKIDLTFTFE